MSSGQSVQEKKAQVDVAAQQLADAPEKVSPVQDINRRCAEFAEKLTKNPEFLVEIVKRMEHLKELYTKEHAALQYAVSRAKEIGQLSGEAVAAAKKGSASRHEYASRPGLLFSYSDFADHVTAEVKKRVEVKKTEPPSKLKRYLEGIQRNCVHEYEKAEQAAIAALQNLRRAAFESSVGVQTAKELSQHLSQLDSVKAKKQDLQHKKALAIDSYRQQLAQIQYEARTGGLPPLNGPSLPSLERKEDEAEEVPDSDDEDFVEEDGEMTDSVRA